MAPDSLAFLDAELQRLDLLLHREILRLRASYQLSLDEFRGLYISDDQVDCLIDQTVRSSQATPVVQELTERADALRKINAELLTDPSAWRRMMEEFRLSHFEQDVLLLATAPELDLKYETLYAYLNNDVSRKWPTYELALRLFAASRAHRLGLRGDLLPQSSLFRHGLLRAIHPTTERPSWMAGGFCLTSVAADLLLHGSASSAGVQGLEHRVPSLMWDEVPVSADLRTHLRRIVNLFRQAGSDQSAPLLVLEGRYGTGMTQAAEAVCRELGRTLLCMDLEIIRASKESLEQAAQGLLLQQRVLRTGLHLEHGEALFDKEGHPIPEASQFLDRLKDSQGPIFLSCQSGLPWRELLKGRRCLAFYFDDPDYADRRTFWQDAAGQAGMHLSDQDSEALANRFILTPGQIKDAVSMTDDQSLLRGQSPDQPSFDLLMDAARAQSGQSLGSLTTKVAVVHGWADLVLPPATLTRVKEIAAAVKYRHIVYSQWGFERRMALGKGLKVLFSGPSGTGKTMTAGVIAKDLGLDLYKIDLSGLVSKYIGETEKNLERIFRAAHCSNAILFFDEADALFGKRSEVKDAHDRYANIEVAYLLQRMEEHEGVVVLASNLIQNIDAAFSRRMHYVLEFPMPDDVHREQLWRGMFPAEVPLGPDVDFPFLAKQFPLTGGDIKNVALDAAFLAAQDGMVITMRLLVKAMERQMIKQGRVPYPSDFKHYHALFAQ